MGSATSYGLKVTITKLKEDSSGVYYSRNYKSKKTYPINIGSTCYVSFDSTNEKIIQTKMLNEDNIQVFKLYFDDKEKKVYIYDPENKKISFFERSKLQ